MSVLIAGHAGVVKFGGIRIAGLSGIYKGYDYLKGHHECPPYDQQTKKTVYHIRNIDVFRLKQVSFLIISEGLHHILQVLNI